MKIVDVGKDNLRPGEIEKYVTVDDRPRARENQKCYATRYRTAREARRIFLSLFCYATRLETFKRNTIQVGTTLFERKEKRASKKAKIVKQTCKQRRSKAVTNMMRGVDTLHIPALKTAGITEWRGGLDRTWHGRKLRPQKD